MAQKFAVIGHPIGHSMSPFIHKRLFSLKGIEVEYSALDIAPDNLKDEINGSLASLTGFNVTIPHKELVIPFMDNIDDSAKKYNAVNCVKRENGKLYAYSTDAYGFTEALKANNVPLKGNVLILGSGGAARTLAREAADNGCSVTIAVRLSDLEKAAELKEWLIENGGKATIARLETVRGEFDLLINATPVGMYPNTDAMPITKEQLMGCKAVFDAVYNPRETKLIKTANELGIKTVGGMAMLVWQAVKAHEHWYNATFSVEEVEKIIEDANCEMEQTFYAK